MNHTPHIGHRRNGGGHKPWTVVSATGAHFVSSTCAYPLPSLGEHAVFGGADR